MSCKVSIVIPVYNVEDYLEQCINSVLHQTYEDIDVILINDGSTDASGIICDKYANTDARIRVVHSENNGLSAARNKGLDMVSGDYIMFLDSDDVMYPTAVEGMVNAITKTSADMVIGAFSKLSKEGALQGDIDESLGKFKCVPILEYDIWDTIKYNSRYCAVWTKIYPAGIWKSLRFPEGHINEDLYVLGDVLKQCEHIEITEQLVVGYRIRKTSTMHTVGFRKSIDNSCAALDAVFYMLDRFNSGLPINGIDEMWRRGFYHLRDGIKEGLIDINDPQVSSLIGRYYSLRMKMFKISPSFRRKCSLLMFSILGRFYFKI